MKTFTVNDFAKMAIVAALYVVLTTLPPLNAISYGAYQFRVAEMLNFLAFYNRRYIVSVTVGCMIANFFTYGLIDVVVGGLSTLIFVSLGVYLFKGYMKERLFGGVFNKAFFFFSFFFAASMVTVAAELVIVANAPFWFTWLTTALGELASLLIGALVIDRISKQIDFTR
ncbi:QueT transporter family protein [Streptococcus sp. zg-JUN1979]|uniref:QueT transporter family protein n=1 Tax=Streptococcus sp. zg-JUN1979 TaxID=3391450 RepID=UPI0039A57844